MSPLVRHALSAALVLSANLLSSAHAAPIREYFTFSGAAYGNAATVTGYIDFDTADYDQFNSLGFNQVDALYVKVSGSNLGNGEFIKSDFQNIAFSTSSAVNWSAPLFNQLIDFDGQFNFTGKQTGYPANAYAPSPYLTFNDYSLDTNRNRTVTGVDPYSVQLIKVSTNPVDGGFPPAPVPEPETYMLMGLASAVLAYTRRRNSKQKSTAEAQSAA